MSRHAFAVYKIACYLFKKTNDSELVTGVISKSSVLP